MQRMNGAYRTAIKGRSALAANAQNVLIEVAASRFLERSMRKCFPLFIEICSMGKLLNDKADNRSSDNEEDDDPLSPGTAMDYGEADPKRQIWHGYGGLSKSRPSKTWLPGALYQTVSVRLLQEVLDIATGHKGVVSSDILAINV